MRYLASRRLVTRACLGNRGRNGQFQRVFSEMRAPDDRVCDRLADETARSKALRPLRTRIFGRTATRIFRNGSWRDEVLRRGAPSTQPQDWSLPTFAGDEPLRHAGLPNGREVARTRLNVQPTPSPESPVIRKPENPKARKHYFRGRFRSSWISSSLISSPSLRRAIRIWFLIVMPASA